MRWRKSERDFLRLGAAGIRWLRSSRRCSCLQTTHFGSRRRGEMHSRTQIVVDVYGLGVLWL